MPQLRRHVRVNRYLGPLGALFSAKPRRLGTGDDRRLAHHHLCSVWVPIDGTQTHIDPSIERLDALGIAKLVQRFRDLV